MISLSIPTYNEAPVVEKTLRHAAEVLKEAGEPFELIVVDDDSPDGTAAIVARLSAELPVRVVCRKGQRGLATAVVKGWEVARGDVVGVMDADLQHPPEVVLELIRALRSQNADLAVASRYLPGGGSEGWTLFRRIVSWAGMRLGTVVLPWTLGGVTDSGSGLFLVRKQAIDGADLKPLGIKMQLEVLAKGRIRKVVEVPYVFRGRTLGVSKLGPKQYVEYLVALARMGRDSGELATWISFAFAGLLGAAAYLASLTALAQPWKGSLAFALPAALLAGIFSRFAWDEIVTFRGAREESNHGFFSRFFRYARLYLPSATVNGLVTLAGTLAGLEIWQAAGGGLVSAFAWNVALVIPDVWALWRRPLGRAPNNS
jgi:dolichol-phosphate mannosyltransferase